MNRFGISTHLFHESRLTREHLVDIAGHGFEAIEIVAARPHFDYTDSSAIQSLREWLADTRLELHSIHAKAMDDASGVLERARRLPFRYLVVHPSTVSDIEDLAAAAAGAGVSVAIEVMPDNRSTAAALVRMLEDDVDGLGAGVCLDYGHANLHGDVVDAIETISGHLLTTHVHDNAGKRDDHLVPFAGSIEWSGAIMATQKIGYDGVLMFEVDGKGNPMDVLKRSVKARERLEKLFITF